MTLLTGIGHAQGMQEIFDRKGQVTWLGLDFSVSKFIGDRERFGSTSDVQHMLEAWNDVIVGQKEKFDIGVFIDKIKVDYAIEIVKEHNASLDVTDIFSSEEKDRVRLKPGDIPTIVAEYDFTGKSGIGLMFIVESFSKLNEEGAVWVTFIDMNTKDVYFSERMTGKPGGFGLRNYWLASIYNIMKAMQKHEFETWRKKYYRKS
jgi:hypothetical protein